MTFRLRPGVLKVQVWTPRVLRVLYGPGAALPVHHSLSVIAMPRPVPWHLITTLQTVTLTTGAVEAQVDRSTGAVRFLNARGMPFLSETPGNRALTPVTLAGPAPAEKRPGFTVKGYHDRVLSYGSPPVRYVRALVLGEPIRP